ncbi:hypothetical protein MAP00_005392 [Monascus purpureus]|nr:hypothetical protein MAP00_002966 [Monascus purpureus]BDD60249.1 hypothetical protein MAP00_005392 [Monascus purpureus]
MEKALTLGHQKAIEADTILKKLNLQPEAFPIPKGLPSPSRDHVKLLLPDLTEVTGLLMLKTPLADPTIKLPIDQGPPAHPLLEILVEELFFEICWFWELPRLKGG